MLESQERELENRRTSMMTMEILLNELNAERAAKNEEIQRLKVCLFAFIKGIHPHSCAQTTSQNTMLSPSRLKPDYFLEPEWSQITWNPIFAKPIQTTFMRQFQMAFEQIGLCVNSSKHTDRFLLSLDRGGNSLAQQYKGK